MFDHPIYCTLPFVFKLFNKSYMNQFNWINKLSSDNCKSILRNKSVYSEAKDCNHCSSFITTFKELKRNAPSESLIYGIKCFPQTLNLPTFETFKDNLYGSLYLQRLFIFCKLEINPLKRGRYYLKQSICHKCIPQMFLHSVSPSNIYVSFLNLSIFLS